MEGLRSPVTRQVTARKKFKYHFLAETEVAVERSLETPERLKGSPYPPPYARRAVMVRVGCPVL